MPLKKSPVSSRQDSLEAIATIRATPSRAFVSIRADLFTIRARSSAPFPGPLPRDSLARHTRLKDQTSLKRRGRAAEARDDR